MSKTPRSVELLDGETRPRSARLVAAVLAGGVVASGLAFAATSLNRGASASNGCNPLQGNRDFLVVVRNSGSLRDNEADGAIAIGGDLTLAGNYRAAAQSAGTFVDSGEPQPVGLLVNGGISWAASQGNQLTVNMGYVKIGALNGGSAITDGSPTRISSDGNPNSPTRINTQVNPAQPVGSVQRTGLLPFDQMFGDFTTRSHALGQLATNVALKDGNGQPLATQQSIPAGSNIKISVSEGTNVLNLTGTMLASIANLTFENKPSATAPLVINVVNAPATWTPANMAGIGGNEARFILWNFVNTPSLTISGGATIEGTLFAPGTNVVKDSPSNIEGAVIAQSFNHFGGEIHNMAFAVGVLSGSCDTTPTPSTAAPLPTVASTAPGVPSTAAPLPTVASTVPGVASTEAPLPTVTTPTTLPTPTSTGPSGCEQLLKNPSFEDGKTTSWKTIGAWSINQKYAKDGKYVAAAQHGEIAQTVSGTAGVRYEFSAFLGTHDPANNAGARMEFLNALGQVIGESPWIDADTRISSNGGLVGGPFIVSMTAPAETTSVRALARLTDFDWIKVDALFLTVCNGTPTTLAPTTVAPTTVAPTTVAPTTVAPTTLAPTTVAPTTVAPTTVAPTTVAPTTVAPTTVAPTTVAPTTRPATTLAPTTLAPTTLAPTTLAPTTVAPTTRPATTLAPTTLAPTTIAVPTTYSLGNLVWLDANNNGLVDEDESGVADVPVRLLQNGAEVATKRTNSAGHYVFTGLAAGDYVVEVSGPAGLVTSTGINGGLSGPFEPASDPDNDRNDDDNGSLRGTVVAAAAVTIGGTEPSDDGQLSGLGDTTPNARSNYSVDFGFFTPASLGDKVYYDTNKDGIQDDSETGVANVTVRLLDAAGNEIARTQTNSDGRYVFENLIPGSYVVEFVPSTIPPCTQFTKQDVGDDAKDSDAGTNGRTGATTLKAGDAVRTVDAGVMCVRASLGDTVWFDTNGNGQQDTNEAGVPAVTVRLYNADGAQVGEQITDSSGRYRFGDLAPSRYMVEFVVGSLPTGFALTSVDAGADVTDSDADPKTGKTISYSLAPSENNPTIDAGIVSLKAALGDTVWFDEDGNGVQDSNEKGVPNVKVDVVDASGAVVGSTITDAAGKYIFTNLNAGAYVVVFDSTTLPSGYEWTASNVGADGTDSDVDPANGRTATSTLKAGDVDLTLDGGIRRKAGTPNTSIPTTSTSIPTNTVPVSTNPSASTPGSPTSVPVVTTPGPSTTVASEVVTKPAPDAPKGSIGDCVWLDRNGNGIQDADEQPVVKAKVRLTLPDGSTTETSTDATGCYTFRDLPAGRYQVEVKGNAKPTNGPKVRVVDLAPGENHVEADFGFNQASVQGVQFQRDNFLSLTGANSLMLLAVALMMGGAGTFFVSVRRKQTP